jgi:streptogramin lyase
MAVACTGTLSARLVPVSAAVPAPIIRTIAGRGVGRTPQGKSAVLSEPRTVAVDDTGVIWFTDTGHNQIRRLDPATGIVTVVAGSGQSGALGDGGPATGASLAMPHGVAVDNRGHLYIADSANSAIRMVDLSNGLITRVAGSGHAGYGGDGGPAAAAELDHPRFLLVAPDGSLIVADTGNYRVRRIDTAGVITTIAGTGTAGYSGDGGPARAAQLDDPRGLALDAAGNLYISNAEAVPRPSIRRVDAAGVITTIAGGRPAGYSGDGGPAIAAALNVPRSIALWQSDLFIADSANNRIRHIDLTTGIIDTVAGTGARGQGGDGGPAAQAQLDDPRGVAVTPAGDLVVGDTGNNRLRLIRITRAAAPPVPVPAAVSPPAPAPPDPLSVDVARLGVSDRAPGYRLVASDGGIFAFGDAGFFGSTGGMVLARPIVGMAATPSGRGYWLVASDGGIFAFGDAGFFGSTGGMVLARPIVGMAATPSGRGYWLAASDGGIFAFGDAGFFGSTGAIALAKPIVGMAASPRGDGYRLVASDGGIFSFGGAGFFGSTGDIALARPIVGMAPTPSGRGYWLVASDGGIFAFGDAGFYGSRAGRAGGRPVIGLVASPTGGGYEVATGDGEVFPFGDAPPFGSVTDPLRLPVVAIAG